MDDIPGFSLGNQVTQTGDTIPGFSLGNEAQSGGNNWQQFQQTAQQVVQQQGLPQSILPVLLSQAAVESARGQAAPGNNYFGIKGEGTVGSNYLPTQEYGHGGYYQTQSPFAAYNNPEESINAYLNLVMGYPGVSQAVQSGNPDAIIRAIQSNGYATSPTYVQTIESQPEFGGGQ